MTRIRTTWLLLAVAVAAQVVFSSVGGPGHPVTDHACAPAHARSVADPTAAARVARSDRPAPTESAADPRHMLRLPDGNLVAPLNGVVEPEPMLWPADVPFAPIERVQVDPHGVAWYVHADGSYSTTLPDWRQDLGRMCALTVVANPIDPLPLRGDAAGSTPSQPSVEIPRAASSPSSRRSARR